MKTKHLFLSIALVMITGMVLGQEAATRQKEFNLEDNLAISGYDPVAYFKLNKAVKGKKEYTFDHEGVTYRFSNLLNREEFKKAPAKYEPEYGGWCAYAMGSKGQKVTVDPETFKIINGKLYLFYNSYFNNTLNSWNKDEPALKSKADASWKHFYH